jgi:membrane protein YdbS with pleckstrin-like domain
MQGTHRIHRLGHRAFLLFLARRSKMALFLILIAFGAWFAEMKWSHPSPFSFYAIWIPFAVEIIGLIAAAYLVLVLLRTWLEYRGYTYAFTDEAFVVTKGYVTRTENATLYHQIQNVNIERGILDRINGAASIVILLTGGQHETHNKIVLPSVSNVRARAVQRELLVRARRHATGDPHDGRDLRDGRGDRGDRGSRSAIARRSIR